MESVEAERQGRHRGPLGLLLVSSIVTAALTWATLLLVGRQLGPDLFAEFLVVWGAFFGLTSVLAGLQQEVTRSVTSARGVQGHHLLPGVAVIAAVGVAVALVVGTFITKRALDVRPAAVAIALGAGVLGYSGANMINGVLASQRRWAMLASLILGEGVLRAAVVLVVVAWGGREVAWTWALLAGLMAWVLLGLVSKAIPAAFNARADVAPRGFIRQAGLSLLAAVCSALLITGFPVLLGVTGDIDAPGTGAALAVVVLTRGPLLILLSAYQGPLIAHFAAETRPFSTPRFLVKTAASVLGTSAAAFLVGPPVVRLLMGNGYRVSGWFVSVAVLSGWIIALLTVAGWRALALGRHDLFSTGWLVGLGTTTVLLLLDLSIEARIGLALTIGPALGWLVVARPRPRAER